MQYPNLNLAWADLLITELLRWGIDYACISPGSRSTPLTVAAAQQPNLRKRVCLDERGAAFLALGFARATGRPALLICTSGTALAHYLPALIEAAQDQVPLLVLSADRPPELLQAGANQAIQQPNLYGSYLRWQFNLPCPDPQISPEMLLTTVDQAVARALGPEAGPVHLNCPFREPLAPSPAAIPPAYLESLQHWFQHTNPYTRIEVSGARLTSTQLQTWLEHLNPVSQGVLLIGRLQSAEQQRACLELAQALGWPVCADVLSGLSGDPRLENRILHFDPLLQQPAFQTLFRPQTVLHLGGEMTSIRLQKHLKHYRPQLLRVQCSSERLDSLHQVSLRLQIALPAFCSALSTQVQPAIDREWVQELCQQGQRAEAALVESLDTPESLSEPALARLLGQQLSPAGILFVGNSMPIRDLDMFAMQVPAQIYGNRGASGIDGNLATALGIAEGKQQAVTLLLGDLALLHDLNSLALLRPDAQPLTVIVINNDGGGIFSFLPIAQYETVFEPYFGTPHGLHFAAAASLFGLEYRQPQNRSEFLEALAWAHSQQRSLLIEIRTERGANYALHQALHAQIGAALASASGKD